MNINPKNLRYFHGNKLVSNAKGICFLYKKSFSLVMFSVHRRGVNCEIWCIKPMLIIPRKFIMFMDPLFPPSDAVSASNQHFRESQLMQCTSFACVLPRCLNNRVGNTWVGSEEPYSMTAVLDHFLCFLFLGLQIIFFVKA